MHLVFGMAVQVRDASQAFAHFFTYFAYCPFFSTVTLEQNRPWTVPILGPVLGYPVTIFAAEVCTHAITSKIPKWYETCRQRRHGRPRTLDPRHSPTAFLKVKAYWQTMMQIVSISKKTVKTNLNLSILMMMSVSTAMMVLDVCRQGLECAYHYAAKKNKPMRVMWSPWPHHGHSAGHQREMMGDESESV
jgi:hypothetical protein